MTVLAMHPNCVVLVDHFAIEMRFQAMLEMLHRYDFSYSPPEEEPSRE